MDKKLLQHALTEILALRRQNEILAAKVEVIELFGAALRAVPERGGVMASDIAWEIQQEIKRQEERIQPLVNREPA